MQKHLEIHAIDCDLVGIFALSFFQYGLFIFERPDSTAVDLMQDSPN